MGEADGGSAIDSSPVLEHIKGDGYLDVVVGTT